MLLSPQLVARTRRAAGATSAEAAAFLARTSGLDATHVNAYTTLINGLVAAGVWSKLDMLHVYATQDSTTALLNLVSTSYNGTKTGSGTFTADRGFTGTTGSDHVDTGFSPTAGGTLFGRDSAHISLWSVTDIGTNANSAMGAFNSGWELDIYPKYTDNNAYFRANSSGISGVSSATAKGHYVANRSSSSSVQGYKDGSNVLTNNSTTSVAPLNFNIYTTAVNNGGSAFGSPHQLAMASIGSSLSSTDVTNFYGRLQTYMTAVGVP